MNNLTITQDGCFILAYHKVTKVTRLYIKNSDGVLIFLGKKNENAKVEKQSL
jgi:hypothetical protein